MKFNTNVKVYNYSINSNLNLNEGMINKTALVITTESTTIYENLIMLAFKFKCQL